MTTTVDRVVGGYPPLKIGCVHLRCPKCKRRQSNMPRTRWDPAHAFIAEFVCDKHDGGKDDETCYYTAAGEFIETA